MFCTRCGANNSDEAIFCQKCGKQFEPTELIIPTSITPPDVPVYTDKTLSYKGTEYAPLEPSNPPPPPPNTHYSGRSKPYEQQSPLRSHPNMRYLIVIVVLVVMLISAGVFVGILVGRGNPQITTVAPTPTLTQSTPTSSIQPGAILYQENGSDNWQGWNTILGWTEVNGIMTHDGTHSSTILGPQIVAPFQVPIQDYAVEVTAQVISSTQRCFGITIRGNLTANSWQGYQGSANLNGGCEFSNGLAILDDVAPSLGYTPFNIDYAYHIYRLEVRGDTIRFSVDGGSLVQAVDNRVPSGGQVGLWSVYVQLNISNFKVISL